MWKWANEMKQCVLFFLCGYEAVSWVSLGRSNQHTLFGLLHFPSTAQWLSHSAETWAWINCHTLTDYLPRMLFCAGRMFEMPVTDTLNPPPSSLPHTQSFIMYRWAAVEECSVVLQNSAGLIFLCFLKCVSMPAHIVTAWRNEATRELFSQGDFMERLIYSTAIHTILLVPPNPPLCLSQWASSSLSPFSLFLVLSLQLCPFPFISLFFYKAPNLSTFPANSARTIWGREGGRLSSAEALTE